MKTDGINGSMDQVQDSLDGWEWLWPTSADATAAARDAELSCSAWTSTRLDREIKGKRIIVACHDTEEGRKLGLDVARQCLKYRAEAVRLWPLAAFTGSLADWQVAHRLRLVIELERPWMAQEFRVAVEPAELGPPAYPHTDRGNSERMIGLHGAVLRYCHPWGKWLHYDSHRWKADDRGSALRLAMDTVREILIEGSQLADLFARESATKWWQKSESRSRIEAMLALAAVEDGVPVVPDELDADPWLLNVANGTIDLRSGRLRPHRREDLITAVAPVEFAVDAECPLWLATLGRIFSDDEGLIGFWRRLCGLCLTGLATEQILPILYGTGANGKSTILGALLGLMGPDYAIAAPPGLLIQHRGDQHPTERAILFGKRLVVDMESAEGARLNETMVKQLTGSDRISARRMREDFWDFAPTHKLMLCTNHRPEIRETKNAIWRRIKLVPFDVVIPDEDQVKDLPEQLRAEFPGILNWCISGCLEWRKDGLGVPERVAEATEGYRAEEDTLGSWFRERCILDVGVRERSRNLYDDLRKFAEGSAEGSWSQKRFGLAMSERGFERYTNNGTWYLGIALRQRNDEESAY